MSLFGYPCLIEIELAQVFISKNERRMEHCEFVDKYLRIANQLNLTAHPQKAITGRELENRLQQAAPEQRKITSQERVFARVEPKQKQLLVE